MCVYMCKHENNVPSWLSPQWLCGNSYTWAHDVQFMVYISVSVCLCACVCLKIQKYFLLNMRLGKLITDFHSHYLSSLF